MIIGDVYDVWVGVCMLCGATTKKLSTHTPNQTTNACCEDDFGWGCKDRSDVISARDAILSVKVRSIKNKCVCAKTVYQ